MTQSQTHFTMAERPDGTWAMYDCDEHGNPKRDPDGGDDPQDDPLAWVEKWPEGWLLVLAPDRASLPVPAVLELLRRNGLLS